MMWEKHPGKNNFFCDGRLVHGPKPVSRVWVTALFILAPFAIFLGTVSPYITREWDIVVVLWVCFWALSTLVLMFMAGFSDPGILPRGNEPEPSGDAAQKTVVVRGREMPERYCTTCHIYRPPRASHCRFCDNCIEALDHHCLWIGNCVGSANYSLFILLHVSAIVVGLSAIAICIAIVVIFGRAGNYTAPEYGGSIVVIVICAFNVLFISVLAVVNCQLAARNMTTRELKRMKDKNDRGPWDDGCGINCARACCFQRRPTFIDFSAPGGDAGSTTTAGEPPAASRKGRSGGSGRSDEDDDSDSGSGSDDEYDDDSEQSSPCESPSA